MQRQKRFLQKHNLSNFPLQHFAVPACQSRIKAMQTVCKSKPRRASTSLVRKQNMKCDTLIWMPLYIYIYIYVNINSIIPFSLTVFIIHCGFDYTTRLGRGMDLQRRIPGLSKSNILQMSWRRCWQNTNGLPIVLQAGLRGGCSQNGWKSERVTF